MKLLIFLFCFSYSVVVQAQKDEHTLTVKVTAIESQRGVIEIALYKDPQ
jgi:uncharacterized protein (DUF2141 family)